MSSERNRIRRIIREQLEQELEKIEDVETVEDAWAGGENLVHDLDYSKISGGESNVAEPETLDIVVAEVRRKIKEMKEAQDQNKDGENDFDDVKIARMKASGMSDADIKKKHPELYKENNLVAITRSAIRDILIENMGLEDLAVAVAKPAARDLGYGEGEGRMTKSQLDTIARYAQSLHDKLMDDDDLPEWVQSKVAVAANSMDKVYHYLDYKIRRMEGDS
jgi:hypothetical protein